MKRILRFYFCALCVSGFYSSLFAQEQLLEGNHDIPEPMIFDLVRELGARQGELELNVLAEIPLNNFSSRPVEWAPEIEYAILDNFAVEFEVPIEDTTVEAFKLAFQYTFGKSKSGRFIHGTQLMIEKISNKAKWDFSLLYIPAYRINEIWSMLALVGLRQQLGSDSQDKTTTLLLNATVFAEISKRITLGLEFNNSDPGNFDEEEELELLAMPQVHIEFSDHWYVQTGVGCEFAPSKVNATAAIRMIAEF